MITDASVIAKWFLEEEDTEKALKIREDYVRGGIDIEVPDLLIYEIANVLRYKGYEVDEMKAGISSLYGMDFLIITPTESMMHLAVEISKKCDITIYDAVYVALGKYLGTEVVTADKKLYERTKGYNVVLLSDYR